MPGADTLIANRYCIGNVLSLYRSVLSGFSPYRILLSGFAGRMQIKKPPSPSQGRRLYSPRYHPNFRLVKADSLSQRPHIAAICEFSAYCVLYVNGQAPASPTIIPSTAAKRFSGFVPAIGLRFQDAAPEGTSPVCTLETLSAVAAPLFKVRSGYFPLSLLLFSLLLSRALISNAAESIKLHRVYCIILYHMLNRLYNMNFQCPFAFISCLGL